jgi:hypothetical protein
MLNILCLIVILITDNLSSSLPVLVLAVRPSQNLTLGPQGDRNNLIWHLASKGLTPLV